MDTRQLVWGWREAKARELRDHGAKVAKAYTGGAMLGPCLEYAAALERAADVLATPEAAREDVAALKRKLADAEQDASALRFALRKAHPEAQSCSVCRGYHGKEVQHAHE